MIFIWQIRIYDICINCRRCRAPLILCSSIRISDDSLLAASVACMQDYSIILISFFPKPKVKEPKHASLPSASKLSRSNARGCRRLIVCVLLES